MTKVQILSLKNQKAFEQISNKAAKYSCRFFTILLSNLPENTEILSNKNIDNNRHLALIGFKISKKYGNAVKRNLLRRRVRSIYMEYLRNNYSSLSMIFIPKGLVQTLEFVSIKDELYKAFNWALKRVE